MLKTAWKVAQTASTLTTSCAAVAAVTVPGAAGVIGAYLAVAANGGTKAVEGIAYVAGGGAEFVSNALG